MKRIKILATPTILILSLLLIILFTQYIQIKPFLNMGFPRDGWFILMDVRSSYSNPPLERIYKCWSIHKVHNAQRCVYLGILDFFFKDHYHAYINTGIALKIIASLAIFPAVVIIFRNKTLAFLASIIFATGHSSNGPLAEWSDAEDYLAVFFFCLFSIFYYRLINKFRLKELIFSTLLFFLMVISSIIRIFPIFIIITGIESLILLKKQTSLSKLLIRLAFFFIPIFLLLSTTDLESHNFYLEFIKPFLDGNLYLILIPIAGLGYMFAGLHELHLLGSLTSQQQLTDLITFLHFLIRPTLFFALISFALTFFISKKFWKLALILTVANFLADLLIWKLQINHLFIKDSLNLKPDLVILIENLLASLVGIYVLLFSVLTFIVWYRQKRKNQKLLFFPLSIMFSLIFLFGTFFVTTQHFRYQTGVHRYLIMASIGWSLFISNLLILINNKSLNFHFKKYSIKLSAILIVLILMSIFIISTNENNRVFQNFKTAGNDINQENLMQTQLVSKLPKSRLRQDMLILILLSDRANDQKWNNAIDLPHLLEWLHIRKSYLTANQLSGCLGNINTLDQLQKAVISKNGQKGFLSKSLCFIDGKEFHNPELFFPLQNLYVFKVVGPSLVDITDKTGLLLPN